MYMQCRIDLQQWERRNISIIAWTVNSPEEKEYFGNTLYVPFMTDLIDSAQ